MNENIQDKDCPCYECICVPICKNKMYIELIRCDLIDDFLFDNLVQYDEYEGRREVLRQVLHGDDGDIPNSMSKTVIEQLYKNEKYYNKPFKRS